MSGDLTLNEAEDVQFLIDNLKKYPDFPKPGIVFR